MPTYIFLGSHTAISGEDYSHTLTKFGEAVELTEEQAAGHVIHGARLLPAEEFAKCEFTPEELEMNSDLLAHDDTADEEFLEKRAAAFERCDTFRAEAIAAATSQEQ
jgi:hypothetical protein